MRILRRSLYYLAPRSLFYAFAKWLSCRIARFILQRWHSSPSRDTVAGELNLRPSWPDSLAIAIERKNRNRHLRSRSTHVLCLWRPVEQAEHSLDHD